MGEEFLRSQDPGTVRVEDLAAAAGTSKGTFYLYFESWEAYLIELRSIVIARYRVGASARLGSAGANPDFWGWVEREVEIATEFHLSLGGLHHLLFHGPISDRPVAAEESASELICRMIELGVTLGEVACEAPELSAELVFDILHAASDQIARGSDREQVLRMVNTLFRRWLGAEPSSD